MWLITDASLEDLLDICLVRHVVSLISSFSKLFSKELRLIAVPIKIH